eukprot:scaffold7398_cov277-Pinguiococcus_pyrenoidosus.AAC.3
MITTSRARERIPGEISSALAKFVSGPTAMMVTDSGSFSSKTFTSSSALSGALSKSGMSASRPRSGIAASNMSSLRLLIPSPPKKPSDGFSEASWRQGKTTQRTACASSSGNMDRVASPFLLFPRPRHLAILAKLNAVLVTQQRMELGGDHGVAEGRPAARVPRDSGHGQEIDDALLLGTGQPPQRQHIVDSGVAVQNYLEAPNFLEHLRVPRATIRKRAGLVRYHWAKGGKTRHRAPCGRAQAPEESFGEALRRGRSTTKTPENFNIGHFTRRAAASSATQPLLYIAKGYWQARGPEARAKRLL